MVIIPPPHVCVLAEGAYLKSDALLSLWTVIAVLGPPNAFLWVRTYSPHYHSHKLNVMRTIHGLEETINPMLDRLSDLKDLHASLPFEETVQIESPGC